MRRRTGQTSKRRHGVRPSPAPPRRAGLLLAGALVAVYLSNGDVLPGNDVTASLHLPISLVTTKDLAFSPSEVPQFFAWQLNGKPVREFRRIDDRIDGGTASELYRSGALVPQSPKYFIVRSRRQNAGGEPLYVNAFGIGPGLAAAPVLLPLHVLGDLRDRPFALWYGGKVAASLMVALSAVFLVRAARLFLPPGRAVLIGLVYGLGTGVWSVSSQSLWQHASNGLFLAAGIYGLLRLQDNARFAVLSGAALSAAVLSRPTSALVLAAVAVDLVIRERRRFPAFLAGAAPMSLLLAWHNFYYLGAPWRFGQQIVGASLAVAKTGSADVWQTPIAAGLAGLLFSPSRGLFVYSPVLLLALVGAFLCFRDSRYRRFPPLVVAAAVILGIEAKHFDWWGGWSYGYRHVVDLTVILSLLIIPVVNSVLDVRWRRAVFAAAFAFSVTVQFIGAFAYDVVGWNARTGYLVREPQGTEPVLVKTLEEAQARIRGGATFVGEATLDVDRPEHRGRLWSVSDNQIAYYVTHFRESRERKQRHIRGQIGY